MVPALAPHKARLGHTDRNPRRAPLSLSSVTLGDECADSRDPVGAVTFPRSPLIASAQRRAPPRRCRGLTQCGGLPARSPGRADAARLRRGHQTWMEEAGVSDLLRSERMGHEVPGMRGVYGHVSPAMRADLKAMLQERAGRCLVRTRARLSARSIVRSRRSGHREPRPRSAPKIGHRRSQNRDKRTRTGQHGRSGSACCSR
jgi:hypothetical protein